VVATYVKVREAGRIVSVAVTIAVAVNTDGLLLIRPTQSSKCLRGLSLGPAHTALRCIKL